MKKKKSKKSVQLSRKNAQKVSKAKVVPSRQAATAVNATRDLSRHQAAPAPQAKAGDIGPMGKKKGDIGPMGSIASENFVVQLPGKSGDIGGLGRGKNDPGDAVAEAAIQLSGEISLGPTIGQMALNVAANPVAADVRSISVTTAECKIGDIGGLGAPNSGRIA